MMPYMRTPSSAMLSLLFQIMDDGRVCFRLSRVRYRVGDLGGGDFAEGACHLARRTIFR